MTALYWLFKQKPHCWPIAGLVGQLATPVPTLLVCGVEGMRVDAQLAAAELPRHGLKQASLFRPAQQVLPLALELLWAILSITTDWCIPHPSSLPGSWMGQASSCPKIADAPVSAVGIGSGLWMPLQSTMARKRLPRYRSKLPSGLSTSVFQQSLVLPWRR